MGKILVIVNFCVILVMGCTNLKLAAKSGDLNEVKKYFESSDKVEKDLSLVEAALHGHFHIVEYLVLQGADVNAKSAKGFTTLHNAAGYGYFEIVKFLIEQGVDLDAKAKGGFTPLHSAVINGHLDIANYLIYQGANLNIKDAQGKTPLDYALESNKL